MKLKKGFTLIELLVVIAIIGILATVVIINVAGAKGKANNAKALADMNSASKIASQCITEDGNIQNGSGTDLTTSAAALTTSGNICSLSSISGVWPSLGMKASNNKAWTLANGVISYNPLDFTITAQTGTAVGDFRVSCEASGCSKLEYITSSWQKAVNW